MIARTARRIAGQGSTKRTVSPAARQVWYRVRQLAAGVLPHVPPSDRAFAKAALTERQYAAFCRMAATDQRHATRVARALLAERDGDLVVAALLHDLGKVAEQWWGRVRLPHRVAQVLLVRLAPALWQSLTNHPWPGPTYGLYLLRHHPALGAQWAARLGVSPRACHLIATHQASEVPDELVEAHRRLRQADDRL